MEPSSLEVSVYLSSQSYLNNLTGCTGWGVYNPGCYQTRLSCYIAFLFSAYLLEQSFLPWDHSLPVNQFPGFLYSSLKLLDPNTTSLSIYFHLTTQSQYHQIPSSRFSFLFTPTHSLIFCLHLYSAAPCACCECQQDSLGEGSSPYKDTIPQGSSHALYPAQFIQFSAHPLQAQELPQDKQEQAVCQELSVAHGRGHTEPLYPQELETHRWP